MSEPTTMEQLAANVKQMLLLDADIEQAELSLKGLKEKRRTINERTIPDIMESLGMAGLTMADGSKLAVQKVYQAHISKAHESEAFQWLQDNGHDGIVKHTVTAHAADDDHAVQAIEKLCGMGFEVQSKKAVHPSTLKAFVKEQIEAGADIPRDAFGVYETNQTTVK
jgi:hypothetical protein